MSLWPCLILFSLKSCVCLFEKGWETRFSPSSCISLSFRKPSLIPHSCWADAPSRAPTAPWASWRARVPPALSAGLALLHKLLGSRSLAAEQELLLVAPEWIPWPLSLIILCTSHNHPMLCLHLYRGGNWDTAIKALAQSVVAGRLEPGSSPLLGRALCHSCRLAPFGRVFWLMSRADRSETSECEERNFINLNASFRADAIIATGFWVQVVNKLSVLNQWATVVLNY